MRTKVLRLSALAAALALMSCNGNSTGSGGIVNIPTTTANFTDATADGTGPGTPWDITQVATSRATNNPTVLFVAVTYLQNVQNALPPPGSMPNAAQVGTYFFFIGPSGIGLVAGLCSNLYTNINFFVDGGGFNGRLANGNYNIYNANTVTKTGEATVTANGNTLLYTIPLSALNGGSGVPKLLAVSINNAPSIGTDCDPTYPALLTW